MNEFPLKKRQQKILFILVIFSFSLFSFRVPDVVELSSFKLRDERLRKIKTESLCVHCTCGEMFSFSSISFVNGSGRKENFSVGIFIQTFLKSEVAWTIAPFRIHSDWIKITPRGLIFMDYIRWLNKIAGGKNQFSLICEDKVEELNKNCALQCKL